MSLGPNVVHVLHVGRDPGPVVALSERTDDDRFLASVAPDTDAAVSHLARADVDCVVCDEAELASDEWAFLHRLAERGRTVPVVLVTGDGRTDVPDALYAATVAAGDADALAATVADVAAADPPGIRRVDVAAALLDDAGASVAHVDRDGTVRMIDAVAVDRLGVEYGDVVGEPLSSIVPDGIAADLLEVGREVLDAGSGREFRDASDGRHYHAVFEPVREDRFEVVVRDVTAATRTERALKEERAFLETVIDSLTDVFFVMDLDRRLVRWNDRFEEVTGESGAELRGTDPLRFVVDEDRDDARARLDRVVDEGHATAELDVRTGDGETAPFGFTASLVTDEAGEPRYVCAIGRDITDQRSTEAELDAAIAELERSNAELEQFAYVASHDLKEPLRMISSYLQLLERRYADDLDDEAREFIDFAVEGADRMQEMINDLLEYSRVGRRDEEFEPVDCNEVFRTVQHNLEAAIERTDATVDVGDLPTVVGDRSRLVELFQNLVSNAIKYTEDGEAPRVRVTADEADDRWVIVVADEGVGIPEDRVDRVFDLFYRSSVQDSTGIGLALVKKIVESHGGDVRVESTPGEGSTFYVSFPRRE